LAHDLVRDLAGAEALQARRSADLLQARLDLTLDLGVRHPYRQPALETAGLLERHIHIRSCHRRKFRYSLALERRVLRAAAGTPPIPSGAKARPARSLIQRNPWCERGDSNSHGLPHWNLNP